MESCQRVQHAVLSVPSSLSPLRTHAHTPKEICSLFPLEDFDYPTLPATIPGTSPSWPGLPTMADKPQKCRLRSFGQCVPWVRFFLPSSLSPTILLSPLATFSLFLLRVLHERQPSSPPRLASSPPRLHRVVSKDGAADIGEPNGSSILLRCINLQPRYRATARPDVLFVFRTTTTRAPRPGFRILTIGWWPKNRINLPRRLIRCGDSGKQVSVHQRKCGRA